MLLYSGKRGFVHLSEVSDEPVRNLRDVLAVGEVRPVKVIRQGDRGDIEVSLKQAAGQTVAEEKYKYPTSGDPKPVYPEPGSSEARTGISFEEKVRKYLRQSEDRLLDIKRSTEAKRGGAKKKTTKKPTGR